MEFLDIASISIRNFLSFGDYETKLKIDDLGSVLVLGEIDEEVGSSNGAGKTSLLNAFLWCLFGKTFGNQSPSDKVINWESGNNCFVQIMTKDGWVITRTRKYAGKSELSISRHGADLSLSTTTNTQKYINELFNLDYDIFCSSVFCGPRAFMEMSPVKRKEALEKILGLDRLNKYAQVAKEGCDQAEREQQQARTRINDLERDLIKYQESLAKNLASYESYEEDRKKSIKETQKVLKELKEELSKLEVPDLEKLQSKWDNIQLIEQKIEEHLEIAKANEIRLGELDLQINHYEAENIKGRKKLSNPPDLEEIKLLTERAEKTRKVEKLIKEKLYEFWYQKQDIDKAIKDIKASLEEIGEVGQCKTCGQEVSEEHLDAHKRQINLELAVRESELEQIIQQEAKLNKHREGLEIIDPPMSVAEATRLVESINGIESEIAERLQLIKQDKEKIDTLNQANEQIYYKIGLISEKLDKLRPRLSLDAAKSLVIQYTHKAELIESCKKQLIKLEDDPNPYGEILEDLQKMITDTIQEIDDSNRKLHEMDILYKHYKYIYRSYSDRRKIKKWLLSELVPYLNDRIHYYLQAFGLDLTLSFTSTLSDEMEKWDYSFCSSGERKRIDVCISFALHDLLISIYGRQCNLMILDEVDGHLDPKGIEAFSELVVNGLDAQSRPNTILVVSHKPELKDALPAHITVRKKGDFSFVETMQR